MEDVANIEENNIGLFGFLEYPNNINFVGGFINVVKDYNEALAFINNIKHENGFIYPPEVHKVAYDNNQTAKKNPNTKRPALLYKLPPSHYLEFKSEHDNINFREGAGSFIINLLSYLFGTRLQFYDWFFDSRIAIKRQHPIAFSNIVLEKFLSHSFNKWKGWNSDYQKLFTNILFMHSRSSSYQWDWERFTIEYMVFDGLFKCADSIYDFKNKLMKKKITHKERFEVLCNFFGIPFLKNEVVLIYRLRNELFHETLYNGSTPCSSLTRESYYAPCYLRKLNQRLIPAILEYKNDYIATEWNTRFPYAFD